MMVSGGLEVELLKCLVGAPLSQGEGCESKQGGQAQCTEAAGVGSCCSLVASVSRTF